MHLDAGESKAIALASEMKAEDEADQAGLIDFDQAVARLRQTSFRISQAVLAEIKEKRTL